MAASQIKQQQVGLNHCGRIREIQILIQYRRAALQTARARASVRELSASRKPVCQPGIRLNRDQSASQSASLFSGKHRYEVDCCFFKPWIKFAKCSSLREIWQRRKFWTGLFVSLCQKKKSSKPLCASSVRFGLRLHRESCRSSGAASGTEPFALGGVF